jgi:amino acid adenylation domain-containing protein
MEIANNSLYRKQNISESLLSDAIINQIPVQYYESNTESVRQLCIHEMFEQQVEKSPDSVALVFENTQLTYRQLNNLANQLAHHLRGLGIGGDVLVGLCLERSIEMIIGMLGILKAGGAYVPLDPTYPSERLAFILADTQTSIILTTKPLVSSLPSHGAQVICLDSDWQGVIDQQSQENPKNEVTNDNLIYVIYTSGSTGQPKGVMIPHRGIRNLVDWRQTTFGLTSTDKVLQTIPFSFDPSVWQIFWTLCYGGQLVMALPGGHQDTAYLVKMIVEQQITIIGLVPSLLHVFLEEKGIEECKHLRHVTCGGEALSIELIERFFAKLNLDNVLHNCYGPTETSVDAIFWTCQRQSNYAKAPIGRPIANFEIYILDENLQPVPVGESGELHIGGIGLARGYLNRPELTREKFIPHPRNAESGMYLYKTGDLARCLSDGNIEFLGRIDHQVKIRGFRIELGEIEAALSEYPTLKEVVVIAREDIPGDKRLVSYLVANSKQIPTHRELRRFLQEKLPEYMVPAAFVFLEALPLNPNGKINRRVLPAPDISSFSQSTNFVLPRNSTEEVLADIWVKLLHLKQVGIYDNFFELGGNSLLAVKLFWQIEQIFGNSLPLAILFQSGTVEALAKIISPEVATKNLVDISRQHHNWSSLVEIQPHGSKPPFFCVHGLGGEVLGFRQLSLYLGSDQPFYGLQPLGLDRTKSIHTRVEDMAAYYIQEIQTLQPKGPYFLGGYSFGGVIAFEMAQQLRQQGEQIGILVILDTCREGYNWRPPLLKRIYLHSNNLMKQGPAYLWYKLGRFSHWTKNRLQTKYRLQNRYKYYLEAELVSKTDKHLEIIDANVQAGSQYIFSPYSGQVVLLRTEDEYRDEAIGMQYDVQFGWGDLVTGGVDVHYIPGSHLSLLDEPHVQVLAEKLKNCLNKATSQG